MQSTTSIEVLPDLVIEYILSYLSPYRDLKQCMLVNKCWYRYVQDVIRKMQRDFHNAVCNMSVQWCTLEAEPGPAITKRYSHSACVSDNSMYVFGGCTTANTTFNDLWRLDLGNRCWIRPLATGTYPPPKACATLVNHCDNLILFGGWTHTAPFPLQQVWRVFNQIHVYNIVANRWTQITSTTHCPPVAGHSATVHGDYMIVFGGVQKVVSEGPFTSSNDVWVLDLKSYKWMKHKIEESSPTPPPRYGHSQIYLNEENILIIGGSGGPNALLNDVWLLRMNGGPGGNWKWEQIEVQCKENGAPLIAFHPACKVGNQVVVMSKTLKAQLQTACLKYMHKAPSRIWVPPRLNNDAAKVSSKRPVPDLDPCVNGKRGVLRQPRFVGLADPYLEPPSIQDLKPVNPLSRRRLEQLSQPATIPLKIPFSESLFRRSGTEELCFLSSDDDEESGLPLKPAIPRYGRNGRTRSPNEDTNKATSKSLSLQDVDAAGPSQYRPPSEDPGKATSKPLSHQDIDVAGPSISRPPSEEPGEARSRLSVQPSSHQDIDASDPSSSRPPSEDHNEATSISSVSTRPSTHQCVDTRGPSGSRPSSHQDMDTGGPSRSMPSSHQDMDAGGPSGSRPSPHQDMDAGGPSRSRPSTNHDMDTGAPSTSKPSSEDHNEAISRSSIPFRPSHQDMDTGGPSRFRPLSQEHDEATSRPSIPFRPPTHQDADISGLKNRNRQRQLASVERMEQRLRELRSGSNHTNTNPSSSTTVANNRRSMCLYVLDISHVLDSGFASWRPLKNHCHSSPDEIILYSLVMGKGELIMFGGIQKDLNSRQQQEGETVPEIVSNSLHFMSAERCVI